MAVDIDLPAGDTPADSDRRAPRSSILSKCASRRLANLCFVMIGFPGEDRADAEETLGFLRECAGAIDVLVIGAFALTPGAPVALTPEKWGVVVHDDGTWSADRGMTTAEANAFVRRVEGEVAVGTLKIGTLGLNAPGFNVRMQHFLRSNHEAV